VIKIQLSFELVLMEVLVEVLRHKKGGSEFDSLEVFGNFQVTSTFFVTSGPMVHLVSNNNKNQGIFFRNKLRPVCGAESCTVLAVPNVKLRMEAQHAI